MAPVWFEVYIDLDKLTKEEQAQLDALIAKAAEGLDD